MFTGIHSLDVRQESQSLCLRVMTDIVLLVKFGQRPLVEGVQLGEGGIRQLAAKPRSLGTIVSGVDDERVVELTGLTVDDQGTAGAGDWSNLEVYVDGEKVYSKLETGDFPKEKAVVRAIAERVA